MWGDWCQPTFPRQPVLHASECTFSGCEARRSRSAANVGVTAESVAIVTSGLQGLAQRIEVRLGANGHVVVANYRERADAAEAALPPRPHHLMPTNLLNLTHATVGTLASCGPAMCQIAPSRISSGTYMVPF